MPEKIFYVGAVDGNNKATAFVPARFLTSNGQPVVDPIPHGSQDSFFYSDNHGRDKTHARIANPNNYIVVPGNFTEENARAYADHIAKLQGVSAFGRALAAGRVGLDFRPGGSQDIQRGSQWGIPDGSVVHAFVSGASHYLGFVNGLTGIPLEYSERGGGLTNGGIDKSGPYGISQQNYQNLLKGSQDATSAVKPVWLANDFGYGTQGDVPVGQIGNGRGAAWTSSLSGIDPSNPIRPAAPQRQVGSLGLVTSEPMPDWPIPPPIFNIR